MELRKALFIVWIILSGIILVTLASPFLFSTDTINTFVPKCEWKVKYNKECFLCGMTRSFMLISKGDVVKASKTNKFSLSLYMLFVVNEIAVAYIISKTDFLKTSMHPFGKA